MAQLQDTRKVQLSFIWVSQQVLVCQMLMHQKKKRNGFRLMQGSPLWSQRKRQAIRFERKWRLQCGREMNRFSLGLLELWPVMRYRLSIIVCLRNSCFHLQHYHYYYRNHLIIIVVIIHVLIVVSIVLNCRTHHLNFCHCHHLSCYCTHHYHLLSLVSFMVMLGYFCLWASSSKIGALDKCLCSCLTANILG